jgi:hypothetical protein
MRRRGDVCGRRSELNDGVDGVQVGGERERGGRGGEERGREGGGERGVWGVDGVGVVSEEGRENGLYPPKNTDEIEAFPLLLQAGELLEDAELTGEKISQKGKPIHRT